MVDAFGTMSSAWWASARNRTCRRDTGPERANSTEHYDHTVAALDRVIPWPASAPATSESCGANFHRKQWGLGIIDHAATGTIMSRANGDAHGLVLVLVVQRVGEPTSVFDDAVIAVRQRAARHPRFANLPCWLANSPCCTMRMADGCGATPPGGPRVYAAIADRVYRHGINRSMNGRRPPQASLTQGQTSSRCSMKWRADDASGWFPGPQGRLRRDRLPENGEIIALLYNHRALRRPKVNNDPSGDRIRMKAGAPWRVTESLIDAPRIMGGAFEADCRR